MSATIHDLRRAIFDRMAVGVMLRDNDVLNVLHGYKVEVDDRGQEIHVRATVQRWRAASCWFAGAYGPLMKLAPSDHDVREMFATPAFLKSLRRLNGNQLLWPTSSKKFPFGYTLTLPGAYGDVHAAE